MLKIEAGRWSRTPRESHVCNCGSVQDESHVLFNCNKIQHMRDRYRELFKSVGNSF